MRRGSVTTAAEHLFRFHRRLALAHEDHCKAHSVLKAARVFASSGWPSGRE